MMLEDNRGQRKRGNQQEARLQGKKVQLEEEEADKRGKCIDFGNSDIYTHFKCISKHLASFDCMIEFLDSGAT